MDYVIEPASLVHAILSRVEQSKLDWEKSTQWTVAITKAIYDILHCDETHVLFSRPEEQVSEFLLDIVAWNRENGEGIVLASECEWLLAPREIVKDFEKLLVIKSSIKLMIFASSGTEDSQQRIYDALKKSFLSYKHHLTGERYIFIDFAPYSRRSAFWFEIDHTKGFLEALPCIQTIVGNTF